MPLVTLITLIATLGGKIAELLAAKKGGSPTSDALSTVLLLAQQMGGAAALAEKLKMEGRDESTEEEAADLQDLLNREAPEDLRFDANLLKAAKGQ